MSAKISPFQALDSNAVRPFGCRSRSRRVEWWVAGARGFWCACLLGCGSQYPESEYPKAPPPGVTATEADLTPAPPGALWRRDVDPVLDAGLGRFLQRVDLQPVVDQGSFVGFRVVELRPPSWWHGVDLVPGDIVTQVNGMPIEQPIDAHAAFESLRKSDKLTVKYLRGSQSRELRYSILEK